MECNGVDWYVQISNGVKMRSEEAQKYNRKQAVTIYYYQIAHMY